MQPSDRYTYEDAGFNGFMLRAKGSNPLAKTLADGASRGSGGGIAFDRQQIAGALGDLLPVGTVTINGRKGRLEFHDDDNVEEIGWVGNLTP